MVENNKVRLIDANALKEVIFSKTNGMEDLWDTAGVLNAINNAPTVEPKLSDEQIEKITDLLENEWGYEGMREDIEKILRDELATEPCPNKDEKPQDDCENCKHQAKLPSQDPCRRCSYCYTSQFEPKDGSEPEMVTNDKLCDECKEHCDWYEKSVKKGNMPIGCSQQIADERGNIGLNRTPSD